MSELSYTQFLELQVKEYRALLDMLKEKHPEAFREWVASQQSVQLTGGSYAVGKVNSENYTRWQNGELPEDPASS